MSQIDREAIARHVGQFLAERGVSTPTCPLCRAADGWDAWDMQVAGLFASEHQGIQPHTQTRVELVCRRCACVLSLRAADLGLPPGQEPSA